MSSTATDAFSSLPEYLQHRIDKAFNQSVASNNAPPADSGGGFVADGGGFIVDSEPSQIPLSAIPTALQRLDLPPDDEQVLLVFKNAASGWSSSANRPEEIGAEAGGAEANLFVSRDDWRSVCAVLLEHHADEYEDSEGGVATDQMNVDSSGEEDEYQAPDAEDSDSDEYMEDGPSTSRRRTRTTRRSRSPSSSVSSVSTPKKLTARQTKTCLETYALFFPTASEAELPNQRIKIKDIQELSKLIGDKLKGDEIIEMLSEFSTAPDKSMSFADFGTMMVAAQMA
ncbi:hypothetical protein B0H16DRAFT_1461028 [Mycena metata]|uniref:Uncharacterized protein n=1 Tax=Mycena metata TaxID=1033252 RepID=A0AAD7IUG2_9AGAR|nr:hypothetical protein B0H16DRAFT_1461028 [Mycena metata]